MEAELRNTQAYRAQLDRARARCAAEERCGSGVRQKLAAWGADGDAADEIVASLSEDGYLDEGRYARAYCESKMLRQHWGRMKVVYGLRQKGVPREAIEAGMAAVDDGEYMAMLEEVAVRKLRELGGEATPDVRRRLTAFLASRGFTMSEINETITNITRQ